MIASQSGTHAGRGFADQLGHLPEGMMLHGEPTLRLTMMQGICFLVVECNQRRMQLPGELKIASSASPAGPPAEGAGCNHGFQSGMVLVVLVTRCRRPEQGVGLMWQSIAMHGVSSRLGLGRLSLSLLLSMQVMRVVRRGGAE